ncbi:MAG TPA: hypothetical protein VHH73_17785 [Verrucomicrobiae bacterium]|nr:hypothetical protein [Verrucomicrobiae bacterium]
MAVACIVSLFGLGFLFPARADTHIYGGAVGTNQNDQLSFSNGALFDAANGNALPQILRTNGLNAGYYRGDALTFSALAGTIPNGGPIQGHAAFGSRLAVQVVSVAGPPGGSFAFWEGDGESDLGALTFSVPVGTTKGANNLVISENHGEPGADPYGHIHGREFTTSAPGIYIVGFRLVDLSTNGAGGGPIHLPSDVLHVKFLAGLRIESVQTFTDRVTVSFRSPPGISNVLEVTGSLAPGVWQPAAPSLRGNNNLQTFTDTNAPGGNRFYRIHQLNNLP